MKKDLSVFISCALKEFDFSFDEVIFCLNQAMNQGGIQRVAEMIFGWINQVICEDYEHAVFPKMKQQCCDHPYWLKHGRYQKTMNSSLGKLKLSLNRMKCDSCYKTFLPFNTFFGLNKKTYSNELEKIALETLKDQSYRRSVKHLNTAGDMQVNKNLLHRMVKRCDFLKQDLEIKESLEVIGADGTGYKPHKEDSKKELKVVMGMNGKGDFIPIGAWIRSSWKQIGKEIKKANHKNKKVKFKPIANVLLSDGDKNLVKGLGALAHQQQRCQWHLVRDFKYAYLYQDEGGTKEDSKKYMNQLWELINSTDPRKLKLDGLSVEESKLTIMREVWKAEKALKELEENLKETKFDKASNYLKNAREQLFTHLRYLIKTGEEVPKVTSRIERFMREMARRMKRIAHNWSEAGAEAMARILLKLTLDEKGWQKHWAEKMKITGNFGLDVKIVYPT